MLAKLEPLVRLNLVAFVASLLARDEGMGELLSPKQFLEGSKFVQAAKLPACVSEVVFALASGLRCLDDDLSVGDAVVSKLTVVRAKVDVLHADNGVVPEVLDSSCDLAAQRCVWVRDGLFKVARYELWLLPENYSLLIGCLTEIKVF